MCATQSPRATLTASLPIKRTDHTRRTAVAVVYIDYS